MTQIPDMIITFPHKDGEGLTYQNLTWTTKTPTQEGWYWAKTNLYWFLEDKILIVRVYKDTFREPEVMQVHWMDYSVDLDSFTNWLGPLPIPELPNE